MTSSFCPHLLAQEYTQPVTEMNTKLFPLGVKCGRRVKLTTSAVKVRMETQNVFHPLSLHDLLGKALHLFYIGDYRFRYEN